MVPCVTFIRCALALLEAARYARLIDITIMYKPLLHGDKSDITKIRKKIHMEMKINPPAGIVHIVWLVGVHQVVISH